MATVYSAYEAKAKLAEILRRVRAGGTVTITYHGRPVAEVRGIAHSPVSLADRIESLGEAGRIVRRRGVVKLRPIARRPGALARFLAERE
jgi:prevent-host-death family protein